MRKLFPMIFAGIIGGLMVMGGMYFWRPEINTSDIYPATPVNFNSEVMNVPLDFTEAALKSMPSVVHISALESQNLAQQRLEDNQSRYRNPFSFFFGDDDMFDFFGQGPRQRGGSGSGVIISEDGYIVTNNHVVDFADQFEVTLHDDRKFKAVLIGQDPRTDLAVIKIDENNLPFLRSGNSDEVKIGEWVLAVGNPFDLTSTVTAGIVSAKGREKIIRRQDAIEDFIQTDAVVNPGNSGGALVNLKGELIGINTAIATPTGVYAGYSFAIPSNILGGVVENIIEHGGPRGRLGVNIAEIPEFEDYTDIDLEAEEGVVITKVEEGSAAQYAGLIPNDVIVKIDGKKVNSSESLVERLSSKKIGDTVQLTINRSGKIKQIPVRLKAT